MLTHRIVGVPVVVAVLCLGLAGVLNAAEDAGKATLENLQKAYGVESAAKARYEAFAAKADEEGYKGVASLFRALAKSDGLRAEKYAGLIKAGGGEAKAAADKPEVKSTKENLEAAVKSLTTDKEALYPAFAKQAVEEKNTAAAISFKGATHIGAASAKLVQEALKDLDGWKAGGKEFLVCQVCNLVTTDLKLQKCPVCSAPRSKFDVVK